MIRTLGILGGGQLGRMLTLEAKRMGLRVVTLEPFPDSPCGQVADEQLVAAYDDLRAIGELGARSDLVTYEFENIPLGSVRALEADGRTVRPNGEVLRITQDRIAEKGFLVENGVPVAPYAAIRAAEDRERALATIGFPGVLKTALGGYDGKGQWVLHSRAEAELAFAAAGARALIYEALVPFERELSIICARGSDGATIAFPVTENVHDHGVLATTIVPARIAPALAERVRVLAERVGAGLAIVGAYCVEFFVAGNEVLVNEISPRVHNSGHYSLDATQLSQYEAHVRAICDLPLVEPELLRPAVMFNVLGTGEGDVLAGIDDLLRDPGAKLHLYGKAHAALRRKMGHVTILATTLDDALVRAGRGRRLLHWTREGAPAQLAEQRRA